MINFRPSEDQVQLQDTARKFVREEVIPRAPHYDETGEFPWEVTKKAWDLGLMNTHVPSEFGGLGMSVLSGCILAEEMAYGCSGIATAMEANNLSIAPVLLAGNLEQKKKYLGQLIDEHSFAAYCVTEPGAGSDVSGIRTQAKKIGSEYVIQGSKMWITNASVAKWYFVLAYTDPSAKHKGLSAFVLPSNTPGIHVGKKEMNMGQRASDTRGITFEDVKIPVSALLGKEGDGFKIAMGAFDHTRPLVAAGAVGVARRAFEESVKYASTRKTFGQAISSYQAISFMIADMNKDIEAARLLTHLSAWKKDVGERNTKEAAMAKAFASDVVVKTCVDAVQVFGGYGYSREYPVEKLMRDSKIYQIYEGTSQIQRLIIAKEIFDRK